MWPKLGCGCEPRWEGPGMTEDWKERMVGTQDWGRSFIHSFIQLCIEHLLCASH